MSLFSLENRIAIVTGAGRGIGRAIAEGLAAQGAKVVCAARTRSQLDEVVTSIQDAGGTALAFEMDMKDLSSTQGGVDAAVEAYGQLDILVNNAGTNIREWFIDVTEDHYDEIVAVNQKGLYFLTQAAVKRMIPRKQGKIIHVGSLTTGFALSQVSVYTGTKGAVGQLAKAQAVELGKHNIQVNSICPGFIETPLTAKLWADPGLREWGEKRVAMKRLGTPEDLVGTAVFLASSASDYVTGQNIYVDGGFMAGEAWAIPE
ncbi:MAG: glucose 1-dehydrogenase [Verrucomicrobia bacterium]|nr:glucose 1-dehydrogenase [Verrucomicrobiota bacterium]MDA1066318.1 glucose 1-dehydrogenase [Verrucomicrobiota bacterium]